MNEGEFRNLYISMMDRIEASPDLKEQTISSVLRKQKEVAEPVELESERIGTTLLDPIADSNKN